jgi:hypothetical protein
VSPDPVMGKHVRTITGFTPDALQSPAYTTINSDWNLRSHL